ncbi:MAG: hypothetical protein ACK46X_15330 [Candidatus Sericytochromatia bacterium]
MKNTVKFLGTLALVSTLAGCGQAAVGSADFVVTQRQHVAKAAKVAAPKAAAQESVINIVAPAAHQGKGAIAMNFKFPEKTGYSVQATANDIAKIVVTLKTRSFLLTKTVATAEVVKSQIVSNKAAVAFTGLAGGSYTVEIAAFSAANANIGSSTESVAVTEGQTATVNSRLQLVGGGTTTPGTTGLGVNIDIVNGL